jgi:hypothetical protein
MKRLLTVTALTLLVLAAAPTVSARADRYYTVVCDGVAYESVDAHAIDQGGKDDAIAHFGAKHGMDCRPTGPFQD